MENMQAPSASVLIAECSGVMDRAYINEITLLAGGVKRPRRETKAWEPYVCGACLILCAVLLWVLAGNSWWITSVLIIVIGIWLLILPWLSRKMDDLVWKNNALLQNAPYTVRFTDREILQFTPRGDLCVCYADVEHIYDSRQGLLLKLKGQSLILADKSQLTPEQFSAILQLLYNAGVKYKYVNR